VVQSTVPEQAGQSIQAFKASFMTNTAPAAGTAPAPKNLFARFIGVIIAPRDTFATVAAQPKWFGMLALTTVIIAVFSALPMTTEAGRQAAIDQQVTDRMYEQLEKNSGRMPYTTGISVLVISPIIALILAGILFAVFNAALGGEASFKQVFSVLVHGGAVSALSTIFSGTMNYFRGSIGSAANLGVLLPMLPENSFAGRLLGMVDIFLIWYIIVLAIGLAVLYRRRTQPIAISLLAVYAVIAIVVALVKSRLGAS
jgi:hypothetical protein